MDWFNAVDTTYRTELKDLNELNFARFDAKLEQGVAQLDAKIDQRVAELRGDLKAGLAQLEARLIRWTFAFWAPTALATIGTAVGVITLLLRR